MKKLHLTCKDKKNITDTIWLKCIAQYRKIYVDYEIIIYDNEDIYRIVETHYPEHLEKIKQIRIGAVLADIFRYLILYLEGGIYSDMDCEPMKQIGSLFDRPYFHGNDSNNFFIYPKKETLQDIKWDFHLNPCNNCKLISVNNVQTYKCFGHSLGKNTSTILCYEFHRDWHHKYDFLLDDEWTHNRVGICQWFIITEKNVELFIKMFKHCMENIYKLINIKKTDEDLHHSVISTCGPLGFTKIVADNMSNKIHILPSDFFCAGSWAGAVPQTKNTFVKHHFTNSWI